MLDACRLATATMAMGFSLVLFALLHVVVVAVRLMFDDWFLPAFITGHLLPRSTAASMTHLLTAPTIVISWWLLRYSLHKPLDVVSFKCRWQLGLSLYYEPVDYSAFSFLLRGCGCHTIDLLDPPGCCC
jgi:hypothetical protein